MIVTSLGIPVNIDEAIRYDLPIDEIRKVLSELAEINLALEVERDEAVEGADNAIDENILLKGLVLRASERIDINIDKIADINPKLISDIVEDLTKISSDLYDEA